MHKNMHQTLALFQHCDKKPIRKTCSFCLKNKTVYFLLCFCHTWTSKFFQGGQELVARAGRILVVRPGSGGDNFFTFRPFLLPNFFEAPTAPRKKFFGENFRTTFYKIKLSGTKICTICKKRQNMHQDVKYDIYAQKHD